MRLLLMFALIVHAIHAELVVGDDKKLTSCPQLVGKSGKHHWEVEQFLGQWSGVELYSHAENQTYDDTCLRLKITEVNQQRNAVAKSVDTLDFHPSLRHLRMDFSYLTHTATHYATLSMTNVGLWKGEPTSVQVLRSDENQLLLTICEPQQLKLYTIFLHKNIDEEILANSQQVNLHILQIRNLKVLSTTSLQTNCTAEHEPEVKSVAKHTHASFLSIMCLFLAKALIS